MIKEWLNSYNPKNKEEALQALREIMQEIALAGLQRAGFFEKAAFYGGTALRIFYGLNRFSEDLDFSLLEVNPDFSLDKYLKVIHDEFELTREYILKLTDKKELLQESPSTSLSIEMRERIVLPLATIQQYALTKLRKNDPSIQEMKSIFEKLIIRCSFGIINAGRNSA